MYSIDATCPQCKKEIEIDVPRWNSKTICPNCQTPLFIEFDFYYGDDHEEFDIYDVKLLKKEDDNYLHFTESRISYE